MKFVYLPFLATENTKYMKFANSKKWVIGVTAQEEQGTRSRYKDSKAYSIIDCLN
jgi:hypothetical protein